MSKSFNKILIVIVLTITMIGCSNSGYEKDILAGSTDSGELPNTVVAPYIEYDIQPGKNILYCSTFQLAWNELKDEVIGEDIKLENAIEAVDYLNKSLSTKEDISEDSYVAEAGFVKDGIINKINEALKKKFGREAPLLREEGLEPVDAVAYSFLYKNLQFEHSFELSEIPLAFGDSLVESFGIDDFENNKKHLALSKQVDIIDYQESGEFIARLKSTSEKDEIMLAKVKHGKTLLETINAVEERVENGEVTSLRDSEILKIPKLKLNIEHSFTELEDKAVLNSGFEDYVIEKAIQNIVFSLDEKGAVLKSEAKILMCGSAPTIRRNLIFDKPFLLYLKEKDAEYPYFAMWVDNPELMIKK
ncbi:MAG: hypothetical protein K0R84_2040 [Clostridia bacterium]|nr:hypothetical protein [Clostridia bacterium]